MRPFALLLAALICTGAAANAAPSAMARQAAPGPQTERPVPPLALTGRVVDEAQVIAAEPEQAMTDLLARLERDTGVQFVVVATSDLKGMPIDQYSLALGNGWALGDPKLGNGLLLVVSPSARQARIEVGSGLRPILTEEFVARVSALMLPSFRAGDYADGMMIGVVSLDTRLRKVAADQAG